MGQNLRLMRLIHQCGEGYGEGPGRGSCSFVEGVALLVNIVSTFLSVI